MRYHIIFGNRTRYFSIWDLCCISGRMYLCYWSSKKCHHFYIMYIHVPVHVYIKGRFEFYQTDMTYKRRKENAPYSTKNRIKKKILKKTTHTKLCECISCFENITYIIIERTTGGRKSNFEYLFQEKHSFRQSNL